MRPRLVWLGAALVLLAGAGGAAWWSLRPPPLEPPLPAEIEDPETLRVIRQAQQQVRDEPRSAVRWGELGKVILAQQFDRDADVCLAEACRLDPTDPRWLYARCIIVLKRDPDRAAALLEQALAVAEAAARQYPQYRTVIQLRLAETLLEHGQPERAEPVYQAVASDDPGNLRAVLGLGLIAQARGETARAEEFLSVARASPSAQRYATAQLAALARTQGDRARAEAYEKIVATLPGDTLWPDPFLDELMQLQVGQRGFDRRVRHFEQERHYDEAAQLYLARLKNYPTAANYLGAGMNLGRVARARTRPEDRAADYDRAFELLREAVRLGPDSSSAQYALALVVFARAERDWQTTPGAPHLSAWFREARDHAERACDLRTDYAEALLIWGMALKYLGQPAAALAPLRRGVAAQPASRELQLGLGLALLEGGQGAEAEAYLENARRLAPSDPRPIQALERLRKQRTPLKK